MAFILKIQSVPQRDIVTEPTAGGLDPLPHCLPVDAAELSIGSGLLSEETAGLSVGDDC